MWCICGAAGAEINHHCTSNVVRDTGIESVGLGCMPRGPLLIVPIQCRFRSYTGFASRVAVAKLRLDGTPTPRSWVARMTKRLAPTGVGKSASHVEARNLGVSMSGYVWDLSGTDNRCQSYAPGHLIHWIHFNHSMREPSAVIPVTAEVDEDGLVHIEGDDVSLVRWNHRPALLRDALHRFSGRAEWKPRWYLLAVPAESFFGGAHSVFSMAEPDQRRECSATRTTNPDHLVPGAPSPTNVPPLRIAAHYAAGKRGQ
jgi:hypothetical protein